jgi:hypothetical protein
VYKVHAVRYNESMSESIDHAAEKSRSYGVRRAVLGFGGRDGSGEAVTRRAVQNYTYEHPKFARIREGVTCRVITSNAGFRGIECTAIAPDGTVVHGVSLGAFDPAGATK